MANQHLFRQLRDEYPEFVYDGFVHELCGNEIKITWHFELPDYTVFRPTLALPLASFTPDCALIEELIFQLGMVELISYWKATCSPVIKIKARHLTQLNPARVAWWKKLWYNGLGEFFYVNGIETDIDNFVKIKDLSPPAPNTTLPTWPVATGNLIPVGGGKDSIVSLELLAPWYSQNSPFILNPRYASMQSALRAGYQQSQIITGKRTICPNLLELNSQGFLNGHTPFSAMLAFTCLLVAALHGKNRIVLSNESSANQPSIPGTAINHQYSKSYEFEQDFNNYISGLVFVPEDVKYFSLLRPLSELAIARLFASYKQYHDIFKSCNVGSKTDSWCSHCPKCLFVYIMLAPFLSQDELTDIWGHNFLDDETLDETFCQLTGLAPVKPLECVGTVEEVNAALLLYANKATQPLPLLLQRYLPKLKSDFDYTTHFNGEHLVPDDLVAVIKKHINKWKI